jgi:hypothetical protein
MRYSIYHRGVPIAWAEAPTRESLGSVIVTLEPAFESIRPRVSSLWRDASPDPPTAGPSKEMPLQAGELELLDAYGQYIATAAIVLVATGPQTALASITWELATAPVGASLRTPERRGGADAPEI